jgi:hypothetical protein
MKKIVSYLFDYVRSLHPLIVLPSVLFIAFAIYVNYYFDLNGGLEKMGPALKFISWTSIFGVAFSFPYILLKTVKGAEFHPDKKFVALVFIAAGLFGAKMAFPVKIHLSDDELLNGYYKAVLYFPVKLLVMLCCLWLVWKRFDADQRFYGSSTKNFDVKPYVLMLLIMIPLIMLASGQADFNRMYPKVDHLDFFSKGNGNTAEKLLYEVSYGTDFISIEFFFRGFLVLAFVKYAGKDTILPMALFYCTIHFGKPLGECISSFFGGILLGVVTYRTGTILGGLLVHLGIAWLMELGGYFGNILK